MDRRTLEVFTSNGWIDRFNVICRQQIEGDAEQEDVIGRLTDPFALIDGCPGACG